MRQKIDFGLRETLLIEGLTHWLFLRFVSSLKCSAQVVLGNHDLHFLAVYYGVHKPHPKFDTFNELMQAPDINVLVEWLYHQKLAIYNNELGILLTHAGICPDWTIQQTLQYASEIEVLLQSDINRGALFQNMYGNQPDLWADDLQGHARHRLIINYLTRMRYLDSKTKKLLLQYNTTTNSPEAMPWFDCIEASKTLNTTLLFGHWAALKGQVNRSGIIGLDTGCYYGGPLTAICLQTMQKFQVAGL